MVERITSRRSTLRTLPALREEALPRPRAQRMCCGVHTESSADRSEMGKIDRSRRRRGCAGALRHKICTASLDNRPLIDGFVLHFLSMLMPPGRVAVSIPLVGQDSILWFVELLMTRRKFCSTPWPCVSPGIGSLLSPSWQPPEFTAHRPIIIWHSPPAIRHSRLRVRRPGMGSALPASHATKCYVFRLFREFGKPGFRRKFLINRGLWLFASRRSFDDN